MIVSGTAVVGAPDPGEVITSLRSTVYDAIVKKIWAVASPEWRHRRDRRHLAQFFLYFYAWLTSSNGL